MAKSQKAASFDDFTEENLLAVDTEKETEKEVEDEVEKEEEEEQEEKKVKPEKKQKAEKKVEEKKVKTEEPKEEEEEEAEDKTKAAEKVKEVETEEQEETADAETFFAEVEKLTGHELDIDYGDTDPLSPQGVAIREIALKEAVLDDWLAEIEDKYPMVFKALKHANNGGDPAELFAQTLSRDYSKVTIADEDEVLAKEILKEYYKSKGVKNEARIAKMIEADEESDGGIVKEAKAALDELKAEQEEQRNSILKGQEEKAKEAKKRDQILVGAVDEAIETRQLGSFKIADRNEASQFREYVLKNVRKVGDKYELATPLDSANIAKALQFQYFQFKNGDLSKIIQQKAETVVATKLKLRLQKEQEGFKKNRIQEDKAEQAKTLKSYEVD